MCKLMPKEAELPKWVSPAFGVPKKKRTIILLIDFWYLQRNLIWCEHHLPTLKLLFSKIQDSEVTFWIYLNKGYFSLPVCEKTKKLLTIVSTKCMNECFVLSISPCPSTDIFQSCMMFIFEQMECHWQQKEKTSKNTWTCKTKILQFWKIREYQWT